MRRALSLALCLLTLGCVIEDPPAPDKTVQSIATGATPTPKTPTLAPTASPSPAATPEPYDLSSVPRVVSRDPKGRWRYESGWIAFGSHYVVTFRYHTTWGATGSVPAGSSDGTGSAAIACPTVLLGVPVAVATFSLALSDGLKDTSVWPAIYSCLAGQ